MLIITSPSFTNPAIRSLSVDNLGEKNAFSTSTINLHPFSLYSVWVLFSPAIISNFLVLKSPSTGEDWEKIEFAEESAIPICVYNRFSTAKMILVFSACKGNGRFGSSRGLDPCVTVSPGIL